MLDDFLTTAQVDEYESWYEEWYLLYNLCKDLEMI